MFPLLLKRARQKRTGVGAKAELEEESTFASTSTLLSGVVGGEENCMTSSRRVLVKAGLIRRSGLTFFWEEGFGVEAAGLETVALA